MYKDIVEVKASHICNFLEKFLYFVRSRFTSLLHFEVIFQIFHILWNLYFTSLHIKVNWHLKRIRSVFFIGIDWFLLLCFWHLMYFDDLLFLRFDCLIRQIEWLTFYIKDHIFIYVECKFPLCCYVCRDVLYRTFLLYMLKDPTIEIIVESVCSKEGNYFLWRVLIAIDFLGVELNTQIYKEMLIVLMDWLVALRVSPLYCFNNLLIFDDSIIDV